MVAPLCAENEAFYRDLFAKKNGGKTEVVLPDKTRCDVVTATHAVEVEFASKWCEGLGQARVPKSIISTRAETMSL